MNNFVIYEETELEIKYTELKKKYNDLDKHYQEILKKYNETLKKNLELEKKTESEEKSYESRILEKIEDYLNLKNLAIKNEDKYTSEDEDNDSYKSSSSSMLIDKRYLYSDSDDENCYGYSDDDIYEKFVNRN